MHLIGAGQRGVYAAYHEMGVEAYMPVMREFPVGHWVVSALGGHITERAVWLTFGRTDATGLRVHHAPAL